MGISKFRLSNMIPNTLFYNLKNMTKTRKPKKKQSSLPSTTSQNSNYSHLNRANKFCNSPKNPKASDTHFPDPPRKSNTKSRKSIYKPISSVSTKRSNPLEFRLPKSGSTNETHSWSSSSASDIIFDMIESSYADKSDDFKVFEEMPERNLPRLARKKVKGHELMRVCESFAMVKLSLDPEKDFRESMVEMIVENNIWESKDLEELLACYLLLNSAEYHGLIVKAFEQIWFNMPHPKV